MVLNSISLVYISYLDKDYSRSSTHYSPQFSPLFRYFFYQVPSGNSKQIKQLRKIVQSHKAKETIFIVMSPCHKMAPLLRLFTRKLIILDAGWPLSDATSTGRFKFFNRISNYIIDMLAFKSSSLIFLESNCQIKYCTRKFKIKSNKFRKVLTGLNENHFLTLENFSKIPVELERSELLDRKLPIVLFRGKYNLESGLELLSKVSPNFIGICNFLIVTNNDLPSSIIFSANTTVIKRHLSWGEIDYIYKLSNITLGQLSNHPRVNRTIPHKAFESLFFNKIYMSAHSEAVSELFQKNTNVKFFLGGDPNAFSATLFETLLIIKGLRHQKHIHLHKKSESCNQTDIIKQVQNIFYGSIENYKKIL